MPDIRQAALRLTDTHAAFIAVADTSRTPSGGPLRGVTFAVKDNIDTVDLRAAGADLIGKTNLHELAFGITSHNGALGDVRNPHDRERSPGGSSGGQRRRRGSRNGDLRARHRHRGVRAHPGRALRRGRDAAEHGPLLRADIAACAATPDVAAVLAHILTGPVDAAAHARAQDTRRRLVDHHMSAFARHELAVVVYPTVPLLPPPRTDRDRTWHGDHDVPLFTTTIRNASPATLAGAPAVSLPCSTTPLAWWPCWPPPVVVLPP
jgi:Asp-tRNA(Asn)/Glu-tRNA(Gln) amidotransferase A subunit family amidase